METSEYSFYLGENDPDFDDIRRLNMHNIEYDETIGIIDFEIMYNDNGFLDDTISLSKLDKLTNGNERFAYITLIKIFRKYRYKKYGNKLLKHFIEVVLPKEFPDINLVVLYPDEVDNDLGVDRDKYRKILHRFYKSHGFRFFPKNTTMYQQI